MRPGRCGPHRRGAAAIPHCVGLARLPAPRRFLPARRRPRQEHRKGRHPCPRAAPVRPDRHAPDRALPSRPRVPPRATTPRPASPTASAQPPHRRRVSASDRARQRPRAAGFPPATQAPPSSWPAGRRGCETSGGRQPPRQTCQPGRSPAPVPVRHGRETAAHRPRGPGEEAPPAGGWHRS